MARAARRPLRDAAEAATAPAAAMAAAATPTARRTLRSHPTPVPASRSCGPPLRLHQVQEARVGQRGDGVDLGRVQLRAERAVVQQAPGPGAEIESAPAVQEAQPGLALEAFRARLGAPGGAAQQGGDRRQPLRWRAARGLL